MDKVLLAICCTLLTYFTANNYEPFANSSENIKDKNELPTLPEIFSKGIISTDEDEFGSAFTPDGNTVFFAKKSPSTLRSAVVVICFSQFKNGKWQTPEMAPFSGYYKDFNPSVSPDGSTVFFISTRPVNGKNVGTDIWFVKKTATGWSEPQNLGIPVNSDSYELGCSESSDGTIYFSSSRDGKSVDIYRSKFINGKYQEPENLGDAINSANEETGPFIAPDQSYILFSSTGREDALVASEGGVYPRGDLYISFQKDGKWTPAKNLGEPVNSTAEESNPFVSADGKTLYFTSERNFVKLNEQHTYTELENHLHDAANGLGDIYQFPFSEILKNK